MMSIRQYLLLKLSEECAEVSQRASKQIQFGSDETQKGQELTNAQRLAGEADDLLIILQILIEIGEIPQLAFLGPRDVLVCGSESKREKLRKYLEYSQSLGKVDG